MAVRLSLLVLKAHDVERLTQFYGQLGIEFEAEQHGKGPVHFAAKLSGVVLEIYPLDQQQKVDTTTRVGFAVPELRELCARLNAAGIPIASPPKESPWGWRAVVRDPDGRSVELTEMAASS